MTGKPDSIDGYDGDTSKRAIQSCRYIAEHLGELQSDLILMGGMVPSVLIKPSTLPHGVDVHVGTMDVDLGLVLAHRSLTKLIQTKAWLEKIGFEADQSESLRMRYRDTEANDVIVDLLCGGQAPDGQQSFIVPRIAGHVELAFADSIEVELNGRAIDGSNVRPTLNVCGPGAFVLSKASAFANRKEYKDAYDLFFVLQNYNTGPDSVFPRIAPLLQCDAGQRALRDLESEFCDLDAEGPVAVAKFLTHETDDTIQADVSGAVRKLLTRLGG